MSNVSFEFFGEDCLKCFKMQITLPQTKLKSGTFPSSLGANKKKYSSLQDQHGLTFAANINVRKVFCGKSSDQKPRVISHCWFFIDFSRQNVKCSKIKRLGSFGGGWVGGI